MLDAAGHDHDAALRMLAWPLNAVLTAALARKREAAWRDWRHDCLVWAAMLNPWAEKQPEPPEMPEILKDKDEG